MIIDNIPFGVTDWTKVSAIEVKGERGTGFWKTLKFGDIEVHSVEYSPGYRADHWCDKGHVLLCVEGELHTELKDGRTFILTTGMSYQVADNTVAHRSSTKNGAKLFIVD